MKLDDPLVTALLVCYTNHERLFYLNYHEKFKVFAAWLLDEPIGTGTLLCDTSIPWYKGNWTVAEVAKILKCSQAELIQKMEQMYG